MGVAPGFMDFPEGKVVAEWHEFQNSEKVEPAYKNLLTRHFTTCTCALPRASDPQAKVRCAKAISNLQRSNRIGQSCPTCSP